MLSYFAYDFDLQTEEFEFQNAEIEFQSADFEFQSADIEFQSAKSPCAQLAVILQESPCAQRAVLAAFALADAASLMLALAPHGILRIHCAIALNFCSAARPFLGPCNVVRFRGRRYHG